MTWDKFKDAVPGFLLSTGFALVLYGAAFYIAFARVEVRVEANTKAIENKVSAKEFDLLLGEVRDLNRKIDEIHLVLIPRK